MLPGFDFQQAVRLKREVRPNKLKKYPMPVKRMPFGILAQSPMAAGGLKVLFTEVSAGRVDAQLARDYFNYVANVLPPRRAQ